jgi:hypothetical protein
VDDRLNESWRLDRILNMWGEKYEKI